MSVRGVWVIRPPCKDARKGKVLYSRRFPTVERRVRVAAPSLYIAMPFDTELCEAVVLKCSRHTQEFVAERDGCSLPLQKPVYELLSGKLWPVLCIEKNGLFFVTLPLMEPVGDTRPPLIEIPSIPAAMALLEGMMEILGPTCDESSSKFAEMHQYLQLAAPFGSPIDTNPVTVRTHFLQPKKATAIPKQKQPSWRPVPFKGNSRLSLSIKEEIQAVQYDKPDISDVWQVYGSVQCKAELENHPDILLTLTTPPNSPPLDHLVVHPCVQTADVSVATPSNGSRNRKIRFSAPLESFTLCHYQASGIPFLPIRGFYQMKGERTVKLLVQFKLNEKVRNSFDQCEVHMPFFHRGPIDRVENISPTSASASLSFSSNRRILVWTIGQRFPQKTLEVSLQATLHFPDHPPPPPPGLEEDPFCVGLNAYVDLLFKISDFTLSSSTIDAKSITLFPAIKYKLNLTRELTSSRYRIWNSHGKALSAYVQLRP